MKIKNRFKVIGLCFYGFLLCCLIAITCVLQFLDFVINGQNRIFDYLHTKIESIFDVIHELKDKI